MKEKLVLGLSGGVDSAVAARLLARDYDVTCLWLDIGLGGVEDAAAVARSLDLPFRKGDIRPALEREVCAPFAAAYQAGKTPLPCAMCNPAVKFPALLAYAYWQKHNNESYAWMADTPQAYFDTPFWDGKSLADIADDVTDITW